MNGASTLGISSEKVCYIIAKARQFEAKDVVADPDSGSNPTDDGVVSVLEDQPDDPVYEELIAFIAGLNRMSRSISLPWPGSGAATLRSRNGMIFAARRPAPATTAPPPISSACRSCPSIWRKAFPQNHIEITGVFAIRLLPFPGPSSQEPLNALFQGPALGNPLPECVFPGPGSTSKPGLPGWVLMGIRFPFWLGIRAVPALVLVDGVLGGGLKSPDPRPG